MEAGNNLPLDLLRLLLEFSASSSLNSAQALSLVSKEVQRWTDPYLFQVLQRTGDNLSRVPKTSLFDQMCMSDASPRIILARSYVRSAAWKHYVPHESHVKQILDHFPNLIQLCLWANIFPFQPHPPNLGIQGFEITRGYPSLRRVATCINDRSNVPPNAFGSPFWMTITHLQLKYIQPISSSRSAFQLPLFASMASLTHMALSPMAGLREFDASLAFSRIRATFPPSLILCLLALVGPQDADEGYWVTEMIQMGLKFDKRIVMWSFVSERSTDEVVIIDGTDDFQTWCGVQDGVQTFWDMGEAVLKRRQEPLGHV